MECYCDFEPADVYTTEERKARREHRCSECRGVIRKGERYQRASMAYEGRWSSYKTCPDCLFVIYEVGRTFFKECNGWCHLHEGVIEGLEDLIIWNPEARRIGHMFNACSAERGGIRIRDSILEDDDED